MATSTANTLIGAATVSIGDYTSAAAAGSLTDVGHTAGPVTLGQSSEFHDTMSERAFGVLKKTPITGQKTIKVPMLEATLEHWRILSRQASTQLTGTPPNETLTISDDTAQYHQIQLVGPGLGTTSTRTITAWKCFVEEVGEIQIAKGEDVVFDVTFAVLYDDTTQAVTDGRFMKVVDS